MVFAQAVPPVINQSLPKTLLQVAVGIPIQRRRAHLTRTIARVGSDLHRLPDAARKVGTGDEALPGVVLE